MFCTQCGTKLDEGARFCTACGKPTAHPPVEDTFTAQEPRYDQAPPGAENPGWSGAQESAAPRRRLRRIRANKKIAGVCAGFAEYFDMDPTLMRLIWMGLLLVPPHIGLIAYIIAWVVLPKT